MRADSSSAAESTGGRLFAPQPRDPGLKAGQSAVQRLDLADGAALLAIGDALAEGVEALVALEILDPPVVGEVAVEGDAVAPADLSITSQVCS